MLVIYIDTYGKSIFSSKMVFFMNKKIILIHNTNYHFETLLSIYQMVKDINYDPYIYICKNIKPKFNQYEFINKLNLSTININNKFSDYIGCIIVSVYPDPYVIYEMATPNENDPIFKKVNNRINICHRFKYVKDYLTKKYHKNNCLCLSPLSNKIGIDHINLISMPIVPAKSYVGDTLKLTIQARFELNNRDPELLKILFTTINNTVKNKKIIINLIGSNTYIAQNIAKSYISNTIDVCIRSYDLLSEESFYEILNKQTDWLIPCLSSSSKNGTYVSERYSTNFSHAMALEKPILCSEEFKNIYKVPGIYFKDNYPIAIENMINYSVNEYNALVDSFKSIKLELLDHNRKTLLSKLGLRDLQNN